MSDFAIGVAEFNGPTELPLAGEKLLSDSSIALAIVHSMATTAELEAAYQDSYRADCFPAFAELDEVVKAWAKDHESAGTLVDSSIAMTGTRETASSLHVDFPSTPDISRGPLTASLRVDTNNRKRTFVAARPTFALADEAGYPDPQAFDRLRNGIRRYEAAAWLAKLATVKQRPGDLVLMHNWPSMSIHGVRTRYTQAAIYDYLISPPERPFIP